MTAAAKKDGWLQSRKDGFYGYVRLISKVTDRLAPEELLWETSAVVQHRVQSHCLLSMLPGKRTCLVCLKRRLVASFSYLLLLRSHIFKCWKIGWPRWPMFWRFRWWWCCCWWKIAYGVELGWYGVITWWLVFVWATNGGFLYMYIIYIWLYMHCFFHGVSNPNLSHVDSCGDDMMKIMKI